MSIMRTPRQRLAATLEQAARAPSGAFWEATARDLMRKAADELRRPEPETRRLMDKPPPQEPA